MKKVLSLLVAFTFMQVQTWALSGGPQYGGSQASVTGTYAGVFTGVGGTATALGTNTLVDSAGTNAVGLFVIGVPATDLANGTMALFFEGQFFQGGIIGIADPNKKSITGVAQGVHITQLSTLTDFFFGQTAKTVNYDSRADGTIKAKIENTGIGGITLVGTGSFTVSVIVSTPVQITTGTFPNQITTTVVVQTSVPTGTLSFTVDGFKQSATVVTPAADSIANLLNGGGTNTGG